ncbi:MAG: phosphotransferase [Pseudomonadota bacterium]|nr:phosphotransferase [Pseudomonadota bacterium]
MRTIQQKVLEHYDIVGAKIEQFGSGLINDTFLVCLEDGHQFILQGLNPIFDPEINIDIDRLTRHLSESGMITKRILSTKDNKLWVNVDNQNWRLSSYVSGVCIDLLETQEQAEAAGDLLGRFHYKIKDLKLNLHTSRLGVHDTELHLSLLEKALQRHSNHRYIDQIRPLADAIFYEADNLPRLPDLPDRLVHGDPKISNLVFSEMDGSGVCMIDLDTLTYMPLALEMGDAFRSWCNPHGEDYDNSDFRLDFFETAINSYAKITRSFLQELEWRSFVLGTRIIMVELAARFTTDALNESYFGWNPNLFEDRSKHNQVRAKGQLKLERSFTKQMDEAERIVENAFSD